MRNGGTPSERTEMGGLIMGIAEALRVERVSAPIRTRVAENLRLAILDRQFLPGQRLVERELVELTGVSRTSVREALRELAAEGLVTTIPNKGTVVTEVSTEEARQIYQVRSALEGLAGRLFVQHASEAQRRSLASALRSAERAAARNPSALLAAKDRFYDVLFVGSGNDALSSIARSLHARVSLLRSQSLSLPGRATASVAELRDIVAAVDADDAEAAARACSRHVEEAGRAGFGVRSDAASVTVGSTGLADRRTGS